MPSGSSGISDASATSGSTSRSRRKVSTVASRRILTSASSTSERRERSRTSSSSRSVAERFLRISSRWAASARTSSLWRRRFSCKSAKRDSITIRCASTMCDRRSVATRIFSIFSRCPAASARATESASSRRSVSASRSSVNCLRSMSPAERTSRSRRRPDNKAD